MTVAMTGNVQRDRRLLPALDALLTQTADRRLDALADALSSGLGHSGRSRRRALLRLALEFITWQRLTGHGLSDEAAAGLMTDAVGRI